jgi:uncharacterized protein
MKRSALSKLLDWKTSPGRKPLIVKGARQVGKTWLVREHGRSYKRFVEINLERDPALATIFERDSDPVRIVRELSAVAGEAIEPGRTLLFIDEVQQSRAAIRAIRYFYEELPELHLITAGSLLNIALDEVPTGVGRVSYLHLYPLSFSEYLEAAGEAQLRGLVAAQPGGEPLTQALHDRLLDHVRKYSLLGGMPAVLARFFDDGDYLACAQLQDELLQSFHDDFHKYGERANIRHLSAVFRSVPLQLGAKFKYVSVDPLIKSARLSGALDLLELSGLVHKVYHTSADGVPIAARIRSKRFKTLFLDVGLANRMLGVDLREWMTGIDVSSVHGGSLAEQLVGQELIAYGASTPLAPLTYWHREARGSAAEVDYVIQRGAEILPIEVKEGTTGSMRSLHLFLTTKPARRGIKISKMGFTDDGVVMTVPFYAIERLFR